MDSLFEIIIALLFIVGSINTIPVMFDYFHKKKIFEAVGSALCICIFFYFSLVLLDFL